MKSNKKQVKQYDIDAIYQKLISEEIPQSYVDFVVGNYITKQIVSVKPAVVKNGKPILSKLFDRFN